MNKYTVTLVNVVTCEPVSRWEVTASNGNAACEIAKKSFEDWHWCLYQDKHYNLTFRMVG